MRTKLQSWLKAGDGLDDGAFLKLFIQVDDKDCGVRPKNIADKLGFVVSGVNLFERDGKKSYSAQMGPSLGSQVSGKLQLKRHDGKEQVVTLKTNAGWGGAENSKFAKGEITGFHVVLVLGHCSGSGEEYIVVYDPDVTATLVSQNAWAACSKSGKEAIIRKMILGAGMNLGALVRYIKV